MTKYSYVVEVETDTREHADQVLDERLPMMGGDVDPAGAPFAFRVRVRTPLPVSVTAAPPSRGVHPGPHRFDAVGACLVPDCPVYTEV